MKSAWGRCGVWLGQRGPTAFITTSLPPSSEDELNVLCQGWRDLPGLELGSSRARKQICKPRKSITMKTDSHKGCIFKTREFINIYTFA